MVSSEWIAVDLSRDGVEEWMVALKQARTLVREQREEIASLQRENLEVRRNLGQLQRLARRLEAEKQAARDEIADLVAYSQLMAEKNDRRERARRTAAEAQKKS